jgi:hypothetical protein
MLDDTPPVALVSPAPPPSDHLPRTGGVDWSLISSVSPEQVCESNDIDTLEAVIATFVRAEFTQTEAQMMPHPQTAKLFRLLQLGMHHLLDCQQQLQTDLAAAEGSAASLRAKVQSVSASLSHARAQVAHSESAEKCLVCGKKFRTIVYLDEHVSRRHAALVPAWRALRSGQVQALDDVMEHIDELRRAVAQTNHALKVRAEPAVAEVRIVSGSDEYAQRMADLARKQDELMEQARFQ